MAKSRLILTMAILVLTAIALETVIAPPCNVQGYVVYHNGTAVPSGTYVNITNTGTGLSIATATGAPWPTANYFFQTFATCTHGVDLFYTFSRINAFLWGDTSRLGQGTVWMNITFYNNAPYWTAALPNQSVAEDNGAINNAINLSAYSADYENSSLTYTIVSQSNAALISASMDSNFIDIASPAANLTGTNTVCIRANDGENNSANSCFVITVTAQPDNPSFSSASDNVTGIIKGGVGVRVTAVASDVDGDTVTLYVCNSSAVTSGGCVQTQRCTASAASNPACTFTAEVDDSTHGWYAFVYDSTARGAPQNFTENYTTDSTAPTPGTVTAESGLSYSPNTTVDFAWAGFIDAGAGILMYYYSFTDASGTYSGTSDAASPGQLPGASQGNNSVYVWAVDNVGNIGNDASDWIWIDSERPVLSGWSQSPSDLRDNHVGFFSVNVTVTDTTWNSSLPRFRYRIDSGAWSSWANMTHLSGTTYQLNISQNWAALGQSTLNYQVNATDALGNSNETNMSELINILNIEPVLDPIGNRVAIQGQNLSITLSASDGDNDTLTFDCTGNFTFAPINATHTIAWWVPPNNNVGSNTVMFWVADSLDNDTETISITVQPANDPPVLEAVGDISGYLHVPIIKYFFGSDPDNENNYTLDNNLLIFDTVEALSWFDIDSLFNVSDAQYYGILNFTPLLSHVGIRNITVYVTDGTDIDSENITLTIGTCGDFDAGSEPWCDETYEDCETCPTDCGACSADDGNYQAILVDPRNCLSRNFTILTYKLYNRASCGVEGQIVQGREVCGNLSGVKVDVYLLKYTKWEKIDEYISDKDGRITFVPSQTGEYKLVATKSGYPVAYQYLEIWPCLEDEVPEKPAAGNATPEIPEVKKPTDKKNQTKTPEQEEPSASVFSIIMWYVVAPAILVLVSVLGYYYYDRNKNDSVWILRARIWWHDNYRKAKRWVKHQYKRLMQYLGYDK
jgi:hypothetical protein